MGPTWAAWLLWCGCGGGGCGKGLVWELEALAAAVGFLLAAVRVLYSAAWLRFPVA